MKRWYVVQVYAGFEEHVKADLLKSISREGLDDKFGDVLIPSAKIKRFFEVDDTKDQQLFPGYLIVELELEPATMRLVTHTPRVIRFLGGTEPAALTKREIERIISQIKGEVAIVTHAAPEFSVGSEIEIGEGPFSGFMGMVDRVDKESEKLTVMVSIFGRLTPVELRFDQVKR